MTVPRPASEHARETLEARVKAYVWNEDLRRDILTVLAVPRPASEHAREEALEVAATALSLHTSWSKAEMAWALQTLASALAAVEQEREVQEGTASLLSSTLAATAQQLAVVEQERDQLREALWEASLRLREIATTSPNWMEQDAVANSERRMREIAEAAHRDAEAAALAVPSSESAEEQG